jgi:hypothetical protein
MSHTQKSPNSPTPKNGETGEEQSQEHAHHFLSHKGDCSQIIRSGRPNSEFRILLRSFTWTAWKFEISSPRALRHVNAPSRTYCLQGNFWPKSTWLSSPSLPTFFSLPDWRQDCKATILTQVRWSRQNHGRYWRPSQEETTSTMHSKMAEELGTVHTCGRGLLPMWWWPVGPKLVLTRSVPEIMDGSLYTCTEEKSGGCTFTYTGLPEGEMAAPHEAVVNSAKCLG